MKASQMRSRYLQLPPGEKVAFLGRLGHEVTILARETYTPGTDGVTDPVRLRTFNEMLNRILSHQADLLCLSRDRYPDDVFFNIVLEYAAELKIKQALARAFGAPVAARKASARVKQIA